MQVVPEYSAILGLPNERIVPLNADHREMCRYRANTQDYSLVEAAVKELVDTEESTLEGAYPIPMRHLGLLISVWP
jgi:hypothetical protein